jgi:hypothetical protein
VREAEKNNTLPLTVPLVMELDISVLLQKAVIQSILLEDVYQYPHLAVVALSIKLQA